MVRKVRVHEFSRGVQVAHQYGDPARKVSGGFGSEINDSDNVPIVLQEVVKADKLRINDNYSPKEGDFSLLAREAGQYSILAVATRIHDDRNRPAVGYRYFWLDGEESHDKLDGIGTLLTWWKESRQPKFKFGEKGDIQNYIQKATKLPTLNELSNTLAYVFNEITEWPVVYDAESNNITWEQIHLLNLYLRTRNSNIPMSWAWQAGLLDSPQDFSVIYSDSSKIAKQTKSYITNFAPVHYKTSTAKIITGSHTSVPTYNTSRANATDENAARRILQETATKQKLSEKKGGKLCEYLKENIDSLSLSNEVVQRNIAEDTENMQLSTSYIALLVLIDPTTEWLTSWISVLSDEIPHFMFFSKTGYERFGASNIKLQTQVLNTVNRIGYSEVHSHIKNVIKAAIPSLLFTIQKEAVKNPGIKPSKRRQYPTIRWLLLHSEGIWADSFLEYSQELSDNLISDKLSRDNDFHKNILHMWDNWALERQRGTSVVYPKVLDLAVIFQQSGNNSLSTFFYMLAKNEVPREISSKAEGHTIPPEWIIARGVQNKPRKNMGKLTLSQKLLIGAVVAVLLTSTAAMAWFFILGRPNPFRLASGRPQASSNSSYSLAPTVERNLFFYERTANIEARKMLSIRMESLLNYFPRNKDSNKNDDLEKDLDFLQASFLPAIQLPVGAENLDNNPISESSNLSDIAIVQALLSLHPSGQYQQGYIIRQASGAANYTGNYLDVEDDILKFQNDFAINPVVGWGKVDLATWNILVEESQEAFTNKQTTLVVTHLMNVIEKHETSEDFTAGVERLKTCKQKAQETKDILSYEKCLSSFQ